ncbi:MAG: hypothetical protein CEN92_259, partial [Candidatus Berkelbacteria bacterium Licking1014_96]
MRPKKFFNDIRVLSQAEIKRLEFEIKNHQKKKPRTKKPLLFDTLFFEDKIEKRVSLLWQKRRLIKSEKRLKTIGEAAESVFRREQAGSVPYKKLRTKTLFKNSLVLFLKLSFVALMVYNAFSLYFEKNWLAEKINNLALASKAHLALAQESLSTFDQNKSSAEVEKAGINLLAIKQELLNQGEYNYLLPNHPLLADDLSRGQNVLELGLLVKDTNDDLNSLLDYLNQEQAKSGNILDKANDLKPIMARIDQRVNRADTILKTNPEVKIFLGVEAGDKIESIIDKSKIEIAKIKKILTLFPLILGANGDNRYLVFFMNNAEMTPGGGFPGNYGVVSFKNNNYQDLYINDIYYLQWLKTEKLAQLAGDRNQKGIDPRAAVSLPSDLYLPDPVGKMVGQQYYTILYANWSLDFRENARRALYLYQNVYEQGEADGVIALTPNVVEDILGIVGPIKMDDYGVEFTPENFRQMMEYKVEFDNPFKLEGRREVNPKQILADLGPKFMQKISEADLNKKIKILEAILDNASQKQILLYHTNPEVESLISQMDASGEIKDMPGDFLGIAQLNINGQKNGQAIERRVKFSSEVDSLGFANDELNLTILLAENNPRPLHERERSYLEVVVPAGSRIREAKMEGRDFLGEVDYFQEAGKTVFGFWIELDPGEAKNVVLKYQAPLKNYAESGYSLNLFKQAGAKPIEFKGEINFEDT